MEACQGSGAEPVSGVGKELQGKDRTKSDLASGFRIRDTILSDVASLFLCGSIPLAKPVVKAQQTTTVATNRSLISCFPLLKLLRHVRLPKNCKLGCEPLRLTSAQTQKRELRCKAYNRDTTL